MATSRITLDTGSTLHTATHTVSEDTVTKHIPRSNLNQSDGTEIGVAANPLFVIPSGGTIASITTLPAITGSVAVVNAVSVTGSVTAVGTTIAGTNSTNVLGIQGATSMIPVTVTGNTVVINTVAVTGSTTIASMPAITGSVAVVNSITVGSSPAVTGSVAVVNVVTITGSTAIVAALPAGTNAIGKLADNTGVDIGDVDVLTMPAITGSVSVVNVVSVTGSTAVVNTVAITGSTQVLNTVAITGSTAVVNTVAITGSTQVLNTVTITGSATLVNIQLPSSGTGTITATTAGTSILVPSTATGSIYVTDIIVSNGATAGTFMVGQALGAIAPTTTDIKIHPLLFAINGGMTISFRNPIKLTASRNLTLTSVTATTHTAFASYYVAA